jgi:hypothetical protein
MSAIVYSLPQIYLDANGLPRRHAEGMETVEQELAEWMNEWPDRPTYFSREDVREGARRIIDRYLLAVQR